MHDNNNLANSEESSLHHIFTFSFDSHSSEKNPPESSDTAAAKKQYVKCCTSCSATEKKEPHTPAFLKVLKNLHERLILAT